LRGQFIIPLGGVAFGVTNREIELRHRIARFSLLEKVLDWLGNGRGGLYG